MARLRFTKKKTATRPAKTRPEDIFSKKNTVTIRDRELRVSPVLDTLFKWMAERHAIQQRRLAGEPAPWTDDPIFQNNPFTNVFRVFDRVTQYILRHVVNEGDQDLHESCFRVILFRCFCRISTWELLQKHLGPLTWRNFDIRAYEEVLSVSYQDGVSLYGAAYQMPAPDLGGTTAYENHLRLIKLMMEEDLPGQLGEVDELSDAYGRVNLFPGMGNFLAFQYAFFSHTHASFALF
ncbi:hypothetical protein EVG20_g4447 [Dentipellis fragilis]|uniref:5-hmdU DNA kinase helical domain-containing protein n=1 Tax=Dentipellis fragilis TaxID=205917 RepID=A0A4Y9YW51_9AGAM|nr:hypothetical protein EVG20_g4447 [Dentipellis fragilis]